MRLGRLIWAGCLLVSYGPLAFEDRMTQRTYLEPTRRVREERSAEPPELAPRGDHGQIHRKQRKERRLHQNVERVAGRDDGRLRSK